MAKLLTKLESSAISIISLSPATGIELFVSFFLKGSENSDYRNIIKSITEATWKYVNKITHSSNATFYEVSTCVILCTSLVGLYENILQKTRDPFSNYECPICKSRKFIVEQTDLADGDIVNQISLECEECGNVQIFNFISDVEDK